MFTVVQTQYQYQYFPATYVTTVPSPPQPTVVHQTISNPTTTITAAVVSALEKEQADFRPDQLPFGCARFLRGSTSTPSP